MSSYRKMQKGIPSIDREDDNHNKMVVRSLRARERRGGLTVTEFRRYRRDNGFIGQPLGYAEAVRALGVGR